MYVTNRTLVRSGFTCDDGNFSYTPLNNATRRRKPTATYLNSKQGATAITKFTVVSFIDPIFQGGSYASKASGIVHRNNNEAYTNCMPSFTGYHLGDSSLLFSAFRSIGVCVSRGGYQCGSSAVVDADVTIDIKADFAIEA